MILTIDVGNSNMKLALYCDGRLVHSFVAVTKRDRTEDELGILIIEFIKCKQVSAHDVTGIIISSVVPTINDMLELACEKYLRTKPKFVMPISVEIKALLKIKIDHPDRLGADRIATSIGAITRYGSNLIVFNFGTATVCEVIGENSEYIGGMIAPGINTSIKSLHSNTSLLPLYKFSKPSKAIATSTEDALYAGIFYATIGMVERIVREVKAERPGSYKVVATGGLGHLIQEHTNAIDIYDADLTTFGLYSIYLFNQK